MYDIIKYISGTIILSLISYTDKEAQRSLIPLIPAKTETTTTAKSIGQQQIKQIRTYLQRQISVAEAQPEHAPTELTGINLTPLSIASSRDLVWRIWREVNKERLQTSGITEHHRYTSVDNPMTWMIPSHRCMKIVYHIRGEKPSNGRALIIQLHGGGKDPNAKGPHTAEMNTRDWLANVRVSRGYAVDSVLFLVPRMPDDRVGRWYLCPEYTAFRRAFQLGVLSGEVDPNRVYLMGISEGGYGSHRLVRYMPDYFAGVAPMAAAEPLKYPENLRNVAFYLTVGTQDQGFGRNTLAEKWKDALADLARKNTGDYTHIVDLQQGRGHFIDYDQSAPWLLQYRRRVSPDHITYTYHNMTPDYDETNYSQGVYYLDFRRLVPSNREASLTFEVIRSGNDYTITTSAVTGTVSGKLGVYIDEVDWTKPVRINLNGKLVFDAEVTPNLGILVESLGLWGDPQRIFASKVEVAL